MGREVEGGDEVGWERGKSGEDVQDGFMALVL